MATKAAKRPAKRPKRRRFGVWGRVEPMCTGRGLAEADIGLLRMRWETFPDKALAWHSERHPGTRPVVWWLFASPPAYRLKTISQARTFWATHEARQILEDIGEISEAEREALRQRAAVLVSRRA